MTIRWFGLLSACSLVSFSWAVAQDPIAPEAPAAAIDGPLASGEVSVEAVEPIAPGANVGDAKGWLNGLYLRQWVRTESSRFVVKVVELSDSGDLRGLAGYRVHLIQDGKVFAEGTSDQEGRFSFTGIPSGVYTLATLGNGTIATIAIHVLDNEAAKHLSNEVELPIATQVPGSVRRLLVSQGRSVEEQLAGPVGADPIAATRSFGPSYYVVRNENGRVDGNVRSITNPGDRDYSDTQIVVTRGGREVYRTVASEKGAFTLEGMQPGVYGITATGKHGLFCSAFLVGDRKAGVAKVSNGPRLISAMADLCPVFNCELASQGDYLVLERLIEDQSLASPAETLSGSVPMGSFGGGYAGGAGALGSGLGGGMGAGGGAGLAGGGLGGLAGIAVAGGVAAAIASDNNETPDSF
jgi:hypothetical protein